jgi:hypothetical protein
MLLSNITLYPDSSFQRAKGETIAAIEYWCLEYAKNMIRSIRYCLSFFGIFLRGSTGNSLKEFC